MHQPLRPGFEQDEARAELPVATSRARSLAAHPEALGELGGGGDGRIDRERDVDVPAGRVDVAGCRTQEGERHEGARPRPAAEQQVLEGAALGDRGL